MENNYNKSNNQKKTRADRLSQKLELLERKYEYMLAGVTTMLDSYDTGPDFIYKCCGKKHTISPRRGSVFPICDECLTTLGQLTKARSSWKLR